MPAYSPAEVHTLFQQAFNLGDVEALVALYEREALLVIDGKDVTGRESMRKAFEDLLPRQGRMTLETRSVVESQHELAVLHSGWVVEPAAGMAAQLATRGLSTEVVRKQPDGTWLFVIDTPVCLINWSWRTTALCSNIVSYRRPRGFFVVLTDAFFRGVLREGSW